MMMALVEAGSEADDMINCVTDFNGYEAWRFIKKRYELSTVTALSKKLGEVLNPERAKTLGETINMEDLWKAKIKKLGSEYRGTMETANLKCSTLEDRSQGA